MRTRNLFLAVVAAAVTLACGATPENATPSVPNQDGSDSASNSFGYGGHALGYDPANNSLFYGGLDWHQKLGEVAIPGRISLTTPAAALHPLRDITDGRLGQVDDGSVQLGGTLVWSFDRHGKLVLRRRRRPERIAIR